MNNRPLFWAVMCFALGEVLYIIAGKGKEIGTALAVLICVAFLLVKTKILLRRIILYLILIVLGFGLIWWADYTFMGNVLFGRGEYVTQVEEYDGYSVSFVEGRRAEAENNDGYTCLNRYVNVKGMGIVDNVATGSNGYNVTLKLVKSSSDNVFITKEYKIIIYGVEQELGIGDKVLFSGEVNDFVPSQNPGEFNRKSYYKARGIVGFATGGGCQIEYPGAGGEEYDFQIGRIEKAWYKLKDSLYIFRSELSASLYTICDDNSARLYLGILLGEKNEINDEDMLLYRLSGIAHIFAISGLHIGIVGGLLYKLLRKLGLRFLPAAAIAMAVTFLYGIMTGFSFSTIRAIVMLGLSLGGEVLGRRYDMLTGMGLALGVLLISSPFKLLDGGLILSFGAVAGVTVSKYIIKLLERNKSFRKLQKKEYQRVYKLVSGLIFSTGITIVTTPLVAYMYFQIPLYSVFINMLVVPLMSVTVFCGFFGILIGVLSPFWGKIIIFPGVLSLRLYHLCCKTFQMLPFDIINTGKPQVVELLIYYIVLAIILVCINSENISWVRRYIHKKTKKWIPYMKLRLISVWIMIVIGAMGTIGICFIRMCSQGEKVIFLDVGQGDGILIQTEHGTNMVVDMGSTSNNSMGEYVTYPALLAENMGCVDYWFVTHFDGDHTNGLEYILSSDIDMGITIKNLVVSENSVKLEEIELIEQAKRKGINIIFMRQGDYITDDSFVVKALHPNDAFESDDRNEQSLVLSYQSDNLKILLTGDIGEDAIMTLLDQGILEKDYNILKVPHHGSKYSYSMKFLERVNPEVAVISCAVRNSYGHPHKEMLEGLVYVGSDIYRTDYMGAVVIKPKSKGRFRD